MGAGSFQLNPYKLLISTWCPTRSQIYCIYSFGLLHQAVMIFWYFDLSYSFPSPDLWKLEELSDVWYIVVRCEVGYKRRKLLSSFTGPARQYTVCANLDQDQTRPLLIPSLSIEHSYDVQEHDNTKPGKYINEAWRHSRFIDIYVLWFKYKFSMARLNLQVSM